MKTCGASSRQPHVFNPDTHPRSWGLWLTLFYRWGGRHLSKPPSLHPSGPRPSRSKQYRFTTASTLVQLTLPLLANGPPCSSAAHLRSSMPCHPVPVPWPPQLQPHRPSPLVPRHLQEKVCADGDPPCCAPAAQGPRQHRLLFQRIKSESAPDKGGAKLTASLCPLPPQLQGIIHRRLCLSN